MLHFYRFYRTHNVNPSLSLMRKFLQQHGRSDLLILNTSKLTEEQLKEYAAEATNFTNVYKWVFSARVSIASLELYVYPHLSTQITTLRLLDLSHNVIKGEVLGSCPLCQRNTLEYSFFTRFLPRSTNTGQARMATMCAIHMLTETLQLSTNTTLEILKLRDNPIGGVGILQLLVEFLRTGPSRISVIDVSNCHISDNAASPLNDLLRKIPAKKKILVKLNGNRIGCAGTIAVSKNLPGNISLNLSKNRPRVKRGKRSSTVD